MSSKNTNQSPQNLLVSAEFLKTIYQFFHNLIGQSGAEVLIYKVGESLGKGFARSFKSTSQEAKRQMAPGEARNKTSRKTRLNREDKFRMICDFIFVKSGWGFLEIKQLDFKKGKIKIEISKLPSSDLLKDKYYHLERGILSGVWGELTAKKVHCKRVKQEEEKNKANLFLKIESSSKFLAKEKMVLLDRRQLERRVERATKDIVAEKEKALSIMHCLADSLIMVDNDGRVIFVNSSAERKFDFFGPDVIGKKLSQVDSCDYFCDLFRRVSESKDTGVLTREIPASCGITGKQELFLKITVSEVKLFDERIGYIFTIHDITREKLIERLKTEFVSIAAHQLRTPLSAIKWTLKMLLEGDLGILSPRQLEFLEDGYSANEAMVHLVDDLLNVSRIEEGRFGLKFVKSDFIKHVRETVNFFEQEAKNKKVSLSLEIKTKEDAINFAFDPDRLNMAISNLIDNAIHYTACGGRVMVSVGDENDLVKVSVQDNGVGIPEHQRDRIFTKFFRGDNVVKMRPNGTGLGLHLAKNIVEGHGGSIWFESKEGRGTTFYFTLPTTENKNNKPI